MLKKIKDIMSKKEHSPETPENKNDPDNHREGNGTFEKNQEMNNENQAEMDQSKAENY